MFNTITMIDYRRPLPMRREARKHCGPYYWHPAKPNTGRGFYMATSNRHVLVMDRAGSSFRLRVIGDPKGNSWSYDDGFTEFLPIVLRLPRSRGFLAGWTMGAGMCASVDAHIWDTEDEAMRAARDEAESVCEREADYQARACPECGEQPDECTCEEEDDEDDEEEIVAAIVMLRGHGYEVQPS